MARDALTHPWFAARGYACLRVDIRGNGDSEGRMEDEYTETELSDACAVIDWIASQPWCSGKVGMMGISWGGFNALQVAALRPPALKAIITLCSTVDRFADDIHYKGGCLLNENLGWAATMLSYSSRPPDPALAGNRWREMWEERLDADRHLAEIWLSHQRRDAYWKHGSVCEDFGAIEAATLAIGGWGDSYKNAVPALVENLSAPAKGIIGPWIHKYPHFAVPEPRIGFLQEAKRWWDRWLKDVDTGVEADPDLRLYLLEGGPPKTDYDYRPGRWIAQDRTAAPVVTWHLAGERLAARPAPTDRLVASPADCGLMSGEFCAIWKGPDMPGDQRRDDALSVTFDTEPLDQATAIVGAPEVSLTVSSDQPLGQVAVRLCHVLPDGASTRITYGVLNLCHRESAASPRPMPVGEPVTVTIRLDHIAYEIPAGGRLRLAISTAYWPILWPAPNPVNLRITGGSIAFPLLAEEDGKGVVFEPPEAAPPWPAREDRAPSNARVIEMDQGSGAVTLRITDDFGEHEDLDHGLRTGATATELWRIHPDDPLCAYGETEWTQTLARGDWSVRTVTTSSMWADASTFHLRASVLAYDGEALIFERQYETAIPRDHM